MDGKSFLSTVLSEDKLTKPQALVKSQWRDSFLIERGKMTFDRYHKVRNSMPPSTNNPWDKLHNTIPLPEGPAALFDQDVAKNPSSAVFEDIHQDNDELHGSSPSSSTILVNSRIITKRERLSVECLKPKYQGPCKMFQKRKCVRRKNTERGLWKMIRCRGNGLNNFLLMNSKDLPLYQQNGALYPTEAAQSHGDKSGNCVCDENQNLLEAEDIEVELNSIRSERQRQRAFLKKHTAIGIEIKGNYRKRKHNKQLNNMNDSKSYGDVQRMTLEHRSKRDLNSKIDYRIPPSQDNLNGENKVVNDMQEISGQSDVTAVLKEIAEEEIDEVDIIMEDISDEIKDLQHSITTSFEKQFDNSKIHYPGNTTRDTMNVVASSMTDKYPSDLIDSNRSYVPANSRPVCPFLAGTNNYNNCSHDNYTKIPSWKSSKTYINEQIRRLRAQLFELKEIRRYLKNKKPYNFLNNHDSFNLNAESYKNTENAISLDIGHGIRTETPTFGNSTAVATKKFCSCPKNRNTRRLLNGGRNRVHISKSQLKQIRQARKQRIRQARQERRAKIKMSRLRKRLRRKERKQMKRERKARKERRKKKHAPCHQDTDKLQCFSHDNGHWKTPPFWSDGPFCACTNSNTNTYWCVRTINTTHNYLYCEFVSGIITYYNINVDPYQLRNIYQTLSDDELNYMHQQLLQLKNQKGKEPEDTKTVSEPSKLLTIATEANTGAEEVSFTSSPPFYFSTNRPEWSLSSEVKNFDNTNSYNWATENRYIDPLERRYQLQNARKSERKKKEQARLQRNFIKRYGKLQKN